MPAFLKCASTEAPAARRIRHHFLCGVILLGAAVFSSSAGAEEQRLSLDGIWAFTIDPRQLALPAGEWDRQPVPGNWDTCNAYSQHTGKGWYQREFFVPPDWRGRRLRLHFEAVYETAEVTLNGEFLGRHEGGYTPFEFDVTGRVRWGAPNVLTVCADNTFRRGAWWAWGGISRSVALVANPAVRLRWQHVRAEPDLASGAARVLVEYAVENDGDQPLVVDLAGGIVRGDVTVGRVTARVEVPAGGTQRASAAVTIPREAVRLWHFDHPHLYTLETVARVGATVMHTRRDRFGIRHIAVKPDGLHLNGERVRLCGFNRVHDHRAYGNTEPDHLVKLDVDLMKRLGGNLMRIMHAPSAPNLLDYLDEKGVMIFAEIPVWGGDDPNKVPDNPRTRRWLEEMITRDFNHPCIIGWSVGNEMTGHDAYVRSMLRVTRELDPHRLHTHVSLSGARADHSPENDPISASDIILYNTYDPDPGRVVESLRTKWPALPVFISEYGSRQFGEQLGARIPGLDERWDSLAGMEALIGLSLWTFNDYRSNYARSEPGELRSWGVVDLWRQPKEAARDIARLHSPVRSLRWQGEVARLVPRGSDEFPSFTLRGYQLVWEWRDKEGATLGGGLVALPEIRPGSPALEIPLTGKPPAFRSAVVTLVSPTGYVAHVHGTEGGASLAPLPAPTAASAPVIIRAYPLDGGFMLGYSTQADDTAFRLEYGTTSGALDGSLLVGMKGACAVRGLENGRVYYARLRREPAGRAPGAWSPEVAVTPDGGLKPAAPRILGVVRGPGRAAVRFSPVEKATGYRLRWGNSAAETRLLNSSVPGPVIVEGLDDARVYAFTVTALNAVGESEPCPPMSVSATAPAEVGPTGPVVFSDSSRLGRPFAKDPSVIRFRGRYLLYYSLPGRAEPNGQPAATGWGIGIAKSTDLATWRKAGELAPVQEAEASGICAPCARVVGDRVHLFYQTYGRWRDDAICHAVSADGLSFARDPGNPVFRPAGAWNAGRAIDADFVIHGDKAFLFYATRDPAMERQMLGVAVAAADSDFSRGAWRNLSVDGPLLQPELPWEGRCVEAASVCIRDGRWFMFYAGGYNNAPQQIGVAVSENGIEWQRLSHEPLLRNGPPGSWNASESGHPGVFVDEDGRTYLFFQGNDTGGRTWSLACRPIEWQRGRPLVRGFP